MSPILRRRADYDEVLATLEMMPDIGTVRRHGWEFTRYPAPGSIPTWTGRKLRPGSKPTEPMDAASLAAIVCR